MELCKTCHSGCCRRYNIDLWGSDIIRICNTLNVDINFFSTVFTVPEEEVEKCLGKEAIFIFTDSGEEQYYRLILKSNESKYFPGTSKCIFLQEWMAELIGSEELKGIIGRCGIYSCRPLACKTYPAKYDEKEKNVIIKDPHLIMEKEHKTVDDDPAYKICSRPLTQDDYARFADGYVADANLNHLEKEFFIKVSEKWNKNPDVSDNFPDFLVKEYDDRIVHIK